MKVGAGTERLSVAGGLTQFGAYVETLAPGAWSSDRHWHDCEDEFLYVLGGVATLHDDDGMQDLVAGDAVCWRHGDPNGHHIGNRSGKDCRYLIVGSRVLGDRCYYPDTRRVQVNGASHWQVLAGDGAVLRGGELPPELLNLPPVWGTAFDGSAAVRVQRTVGRVWVEEANPAHSRLGARLGRYRHCVLGDQGGLSQFGVHLECLPPGSRSSFRHWHEAEDEMVYVLSGALVLVEDTEAELQAGDAACWPAGVAVAHCLENRADAEASYLIIGTRKDADVIHYPDDDLITYRTGETRRYLHADGRDFAAKPN